MAPETYWEREEPPHGLWKRKARPDPADPFADIFLSPGLGQLTGPLLAHTHPGKLIINKADKRTWYFNCVKSIHKGRTVQPPPPLCGPTGWEQTEPAHSGGFYINLPSKNGLQTSSGGFYMVLLPPMLLFLFLILLFFNTCPFFCLRETVYHIFTECKRLTSFFSLLTFVFSFFDVVFTESFYNGSCLQKRKKRKMAATKLPLR